jgi:protein-S-isoprenylcysteine O-methyltransferase Ste14
MTQSSTLKSIAFVLIQFACLALIFLTGPIFPRKLVLLLVELLGIGLGVWAVLAMGIGNFNITPDPLQSSRLITRGPYLWVRHPMYLALLVTTLPLIVAEFSVWRLVLWVVLLIDLVLKLNYEERLLDDSLTGYAEYRKSSRRLIPFIY